MARGPLGAPGRGSLALWDLLRNHVKGLRQARLSVVFDDLFLLTTVWIHCFTSFILLIFEGGGLDLKSYFLPRLGHHESYGHETTSVLYSISTRIQWNASRTSKPDFFTNKSVSFVFPPVSSAEEWPCLFSHRSL